MADWYQSTNKHIFTKLGVSVDSGLSTGEIGRRLKRYGPNKIGIDKKINPWKLFISQFHDVLIIILLIAASISLVIGLVGEEGSLTESILIFVIVFAIALIGFLNEFKAEKTVEALRKLMGHTAKVRRGGKEEEVNAEELVPGDILVLEEGQKIPADARIIQTHMLQTNEASLTGESMPVMKDNVNLSGPKALGDQVNMLFAGTTIVSGNGLAIVVSTGAKTELGKIAGLVESVEEEQTPMQKKLDLLGKKLGALVLFVSVIVFILVFFFDQDFMNEALAQRLILAFTAAVALAVAAIPEGLAFVVRISLALGARRMASKQALAKRLSAVEALGSTDIICADKTGTLTKGEMTVRMLYTQGRMFELSGAGYETKGILSENGKKVKDAKVLGPILRLGLMVNNARLESDKVLGDPTEAALLVSAKKLGLDQSEILKQKPRIDEMPFSSIRKMMSTVHQDGSKYHVAVKGAPDILLTVCNSTLVNGKVVKLTPKLRQEILDANHKMTTQALRVLGFAYKSTQEQPRSASASESNLIFVGLQGMIDPPRQEVKSVIHRVQTEAGMRVVMITGDHIETAKAVAREIGIEGEAMTGQELDQLSLEQFQQKVASVGVYARVNPEHKIAIVKALKANGHQIAMTGDGVNDSPAIKAADIGIAMGITGTDATKEAADLILLNDQFPTIIDAVEEGRGIFDNVRKFVNYLLSANIAEVIAIVGGLFWFNALVLSAAQLLFINIVTDGLPAVALGSDPAEKGIMKYKPHRFQSNIITKRIWTEMIIFGLLMASALLIHYWWIVAEFGDSARAMSVMFTGMVVYEMIRLVGIRSEYNIKWFSNPWLSVAIAGSLILQVAVLYFAPLANLFGVKPIELTDWALIGLVSLGLLMTMKLADKVLDRVFKETRPQYAHHHYEKT